MVWLPFLAFSHILGISSSQLTFIFFRGVAQTPTRYDKLWFYLCLCFWHSDDLRWSQHSESMSPLDQGPSRRHKFSPLTVKQFLTSAMEIFYNRCNYFKENSLIALKNCWRHSGIKVDMIWTFQNLQLLPNVTNWLVVWNIFYFPIYWE